MRRPGAVLNAAAHEVVGLIASSVQRYLTADVAELGLPARYRA